MESKLPPGVVRPENRNVLSAETLASIKRMAAQGVNLDVIAKYHSVSPDFLQQRHGAEIAQAYLDSNLRVLEALHRMAVSGRNPTATIFWLNNHCAELLATSREKKGASADEDKFPPSSSSPHSTKTSRSSTFQKPKFDRVVFHVYNNEGEPNVEC